ncbi:hypothetical protein BLNAU_10092 [Blattamonas nauphoetae]|uniref:Uncharacterized protein n=1 Tax=Blattamonas nauphoetae TaxID=2049346 RepID=A0ABQ9XTZ8_9EUKA|nr:hypothetical protein BLNAU_10092 [Blattamonas nauphoetae]
MIFRNQSFGVPLSLTLKLRTTSNKPDANKDNKQLQATTLVSTQSTQLVESSRMEQHIARLVVAYSQRVLDHEQEITIGSYRNITVISKMGNIQGKLYNTGNEGAE